MRYGEFDTAVVIKSWKNIFLPGIDASIGNLARFHAASNQAIALAETENHIDLTSR